MGAQAQPPARERRPPPYAVPEGRVGRQQRKREQNSKKEKKVEKRYFRRSENETTTTKWNKTTTAGKARKGPQGGRCLGWRPQQLEKTLGGGEGLGLGPSRLEGTPEGGDSGSRPWQTCQCLSGWVRCWAHSLLIHCLPKSLPIPANPPSVCGPFWEWWPPSSSCCSSGFLLPSHLYFSFSSLCPHHPTQSLGNSSHPLGVRGLSAALVDARSVRRRELSILRLCHLESTQKDLLVGEILCFLNRCLENVLWNLSPEYVKFFHAPVHAVYFKFYFLCITGI